MWSFMELLHSEIFPCYTGKRCRHTPFTSTRTKSLKNSRPPASFSLSYIELWTNCGTNSVIFFCEQKNFLYYHKDKKFVIVAVLQKISEKTKKDRDLRQRTDDLSSVLPDSHGHPDISSTFSLHWLSPDYFRWHYSHYQKYILPWYEAFPPVCAFMIPHSRAS